MKKIITTIFLLFLIITVAYSQDITGKWFGKINVSGISLRIAFDIQPVENGYTATMDSPDQGAMGIPVDSVSFEDGELLLSIPKLFFSYSAKLLSPELLEGTFSQMGNTLPLNLTREETKPNRPQTPQPPFPYKSEDIQFRNNEAGITLAGTLTTPAKEGKFPAVVLITGSGAQNRDEELFEHKPFLVIADYLTRRGIAVLRFDDRGTAESEGDFARATSADFATDVNAGIDYLRTRNDIDGQRIGLLGHSEGGTIACMLAAAEPEKVAFVISMAGTAVKGDSLLILQRQALFSTMGMNEEGLQKDKERMRTAFSLVEETDDKSILKEEFLELFKGFQGSEKEVNAIIHQLTSPWMRFFANYDPAKDLAKVTCPVLAINGAKDLQVPADVNLGVISSVVSSNGNQHVTVKEYPELNHLFQKCTTGLPAEYAQIEETISPQVLEDIGDWIESTVNN